MSEQRDELVEEQKNRQFFGLFYQVIYRLIKVAVLVLLVLALFYGVKMAYSFGYTIFTEKTPEEAPGTDIPVTITLDMNTRAVGRYLKDMGVVSNSNIFVVQAAIYGYDIFPGEYVLNSSMSIEQILVALSEEPEEAEE